VLHHPAYGEQRVVASPLGRNLTRCENIAPPLLGEHTSSILSELGYAPDEIVRLTNDRVVATAEGATLHIEEVPAT
jgi:crotonobetainyl-CoA:carnitine CoA-transferase CaiB-like acyl-CoA transferase